MSTDPFKINYALDQNKMNVFSINVFQGIKYRVF